MNIEHLNAVGEVTELIYIAREEEEKYAHWGAVAAITEAIYFAKNQA